MRKVLSVLAILAIFFASCSDGDVAKPFVAQYAETLISQYPNYASNDMAKSIVKDSISNHIKSYIGNDAKDLDGVEFHFDKLIDGKKGKCAVFTSNIYISIDAPANNQDKYIIGNVKIIAFGNVDDTIASKLDNKIKYSISGILHDWDDGNALNIIYSSSYDDLDFGTYILDDMKVKEYEPQEKL